MKNILFILLSLIIISCSKDDDKIDSSKFIGDYELKNCFTDIKFYSNAEGGCEIRKEGDKIIFDISVDKTETENVQYSGYLDGKIMKFNNGDYFGEIVEGTISIWVYQNEGTVYEFGYYKGDNLPSSSGRCQAITQKGTQCKRKASKGSIYCWQHKK